MENILLAIKNITGGLFKMYSKGKIITVSLVAAVVLGIGIVKEGVLGKDKLEEASNIQSVVVSAENTSSTTEATITEPKGCPGGCRGKKDLSLL